MPNISEEVRDTSSPVWDMSQERMLTEQLVGQRFNFFLVFFSVIVAGAVNAKVQLHLQSVLTIGSIICFVLTRALYRTSNRLDVILSILREDNTHPYTIVSKRIGGTGVRKILWQYLPSFCYASLVIAAVLAWCGVLVVPGR